MLRGHANAGTREILCRRRFFAPRLALGQRCNFVPIQGSRSRIVALLDGLVRLPVWLILEELPGSLIAARLHLLQLNVLPLVHRNGTHEGQVHSQAPVLPTALQTDPYAVRDRDPLGVVGSALEASLERGKDEKREI